MSSLAEDGYERLRGFLSQSEVDALLAKVPKLGPDAGTRDLLSFDWCRDLANKPSVLAAIQRGLSGRIRAVRGILFDKSPAANWSLGWHQDTKVAVQRVGLGPWPGFSAWTEKEGIPHCLPPVEVLEQCLAIRIHLDPCPEDNGPLRVMKGSHALGRQVEPPDLPMEVLTADAGDALLIRPLLWHASTRSQRPSHRRVIHLEYCSADLPEGLEWFFGGSVVAAPFAPDGGQSPERSEGRGLGCGPGRRAP